MAVSHQDCCCDWAGLAPKIFCKQLRWFLSLYLNFVVVVFDVFVFCIWSCLSPRLSLTAIADWAGSAPKSLCLQLRWFSHRSKSWWFPQDYRIILSCRRSGTSSTAPWKWLMRHKNRRLRMRREKRDHCFQRQMGEESLIVVGLQWQKVDRGERLWKRAEIRACYHAQLLLLAGPPAHKEQEEGRRTGEQLKWV